VQSTISNSWKRESENARELRVAQSLLGYDHLGPSRLVDMAWRKSAAKAGASPVPKLCQNAMFFVLLGLALSEKQIPQIAENTEKSK
jgi:hypothetical protein